MGRDPRSHQSPGANQADAAILGQAKSLQCIHFDHPNRSMLLTDIPIAAKTVAEVIEAIIAVVGRRLSARPDASPSCSGRRGPAGSSVGAGAASLAHAIQAIHPESETTRLMAPTVSHLARPIVHPVLGPGKV